MMKRCARCNQDLPLDRFGVQKHKNGKTYPTAYCLPCRSIMARERRMKDGDAVREKSREYRKREAVRERERAYERKNQKAFYAKKIASRDAVRGQLYAILGGRCSECGIPPGKKRLDVHHVRGDGAADREKYGTGIGYYRALVERATGDPGSLEVVCASCHKRRHNLKKGVRDAI